MNCSSSESVSNDFITTLAFKCFIRQMIRYDTIEEFNVDSKAECDQLNLAHETKTKTPVYS